MKLVYGVVGLCMAGSAGGCVYATIDGFHHDSAPEVSIIIAAIYLVIAYAVVRYCRMKIRSLGGLPAVGAATATTGKDSESIAAILAARKAERAQRQTESGQSSGIGRQEIK